VSTPVGPGRARSRPAIGLAALCLVALSLAGCGEGKTEPCTQSDLDRPGPAGAVPAVAVTQTRSLNGDRLEALPPRMQPSVSAAAARRVLGRARPVSGGGRDELLLGLFTGTGYARVPAWVLFTSHLAQPLAPAVLPPGFKRRANADVCVFVDILTVLNALTGQIFYSSTFTTDSRPPDVPTTGPTGPART
jgi:hypothetical protein